MANLYKKYLKLLDKWPVNNSLSTDLGFFIREQVKIAFSKGEKSIIDEKNCKLQYESLERLASNCYGKKYPTNFKQTASGISPEYCKIALTPEFQEYCNKRNSGLFYKFRNRIQATVFKYVKSKDNSSSL